MAATSTVIDDPHRRARLEVLVEGSGPEVVMLPSAQRGAADFEALQRALAEAGYRSIAINPRGAGRSAGPTDAMTLRDVTDDVAAVIRSVAVAPVHIVGHALGNIVARATASYHRELITSVTTMPCGGHNLDRHPVPAAVPRYMPRCHDMSLTRDERLEALRVCFFAPGNEPPQSWLDGWWPATSWVSAAYAASDPDEWWRAGGAPMLIVQPLDDVMGTVAAGRETALALGPQAWYVEVPHCGHAVLPEQPEVIADLIIRFLGDHP